LEGITAKLFRRKLSDISAERNKVGEIAPTKRTILHSKCVSISSFTPENYSTNTTSRKYIPLHLSDKRAGSGRFAAPTEEPRSATILRGWINSPRINSK
jgi:hypothetical protein